MDKFQQAVDIIHDLILETKDEDTRQRLSDGLRAMGAYRDNAENCPECKISFQGAEIPKEHQWSFFATHFSKKIGTEVPGVYDGVSKWMCFSCKHEWNRFPFS